MKDITTEISRIGGGQVNTGAFLTGDRGYGSESLARHLARQGIGSIFILKKHLNNCSPWVAASQCGDSNERFGPGEDDRFSDRDGTDDEDIDDVEDVRAGGRPNRFLINDDPHAGPAVFVAKKGVKIPGKTSRQAMFAVAVREDGDQENTAVHRFVLSLPGIDIEDMTKWIAVPRPGVLNRHLFSGAPACSSVADHRRRVSSTFVQFASLCSNYQPFRSRVI